MHRCALFLAAAIFAVPALAACQPKSPAVQPAPSATSGATPGEAAAFFAKNAKAPGVVTLPSGLQYKILRSGPADGPHPVKGDLIKIDYEGSLLDGTVFDSTRKEGTPAVLTLGRLVPGWEEALPLMRPGDSWVLYLPPALGYGDRETGPIPAGSALVFTIDLKGVLPTGSHNGLG